MDSSDLRIINLLLKDSRMQLSKIAAELGISQPAAQKRIAKLRAEGIILGSTAVLNTDKLGWKRVIVALNIRKAGYDGLLGLLMKLPFVKGVYHATGPYGIVVEFLGPAAVVSGVIARMKKLRGVVDCCPMSIVEKVI